MIHQPTPSCIAISKIGKYKEIGIVKGQLCILYNYGGYIGEDAYDNETEEIDLPPGNWKILGRGNELTEEQWKGIVDFKESLPYTDYENKRGTPHFADYMKPLFLPPNWNDPVGYEMKLDTATESGLSLLKSHNLEPDVLILIKDKQ